MPINFNDGEGVDGDRTSLGSTYPEHADGSSEAWGRCEPLITPSKLKSRYLKGLPLVSPITKEKWTNSDLKDYINRGAAMAELTSMIDVFPVKYKQKFPFDSHLYTKWVHIEIPRKPINRVISLTITTADGTNVFTMPNRWIETSNFQRGLINVIPISPAFAAIGAQTSAATGGAAFLTFIGQLGWIPAYWQVEWITGFDEKKIPLIFNELIGIRAAMLLLSQLASAHGKTTSHSLSTDGLSQSVGGPGPSIFQVRMAELEKWEHEILQRLKKMYSNSIIVSNV